jgi:hypothetical protein
MNLTWHINIIRQNFGRKLIVITVKILYAATKHVLRLHIFIVANKHDDVFFNIFWGLFYFLFKKMLRHKDENDIVYFV